MLIRYDTEKSKAIQKLKLLMEILHIFCPSIIDNHYPHRPIELESISLYEFAQWYDITKVKPCNKKIEYYKMDNGLYLKRRQRGYLINHYRYNVNMKPEKYFFSLLLMFKPWQKIEDLRNGCHNYAESFHKIKLHLVEALQYHEKLEELQKAFETAKQLLQQHLDELEKQHVSQDDPDNPIGVQNIEAGEAMQDLKDLSDKCVEQIDICEMISKLNADQRRVFDRVINAVTSNESLLRLYVGGGGTGKSFLIKTIKCWIKQNLNKNTAIAVPIGIAAFNIDGLTVHRLLQLPVKHGHTPKYKQLSDHVLKVLLTDLKDVILFIIDEVSMISNLTLMYIHLRLSEIFDTADRDDGWFGRKHILLLRDLLQLPPVHEDPAFVHLSDEKMYTSVKFAYWNAVKRVFKYLFGTIKQGIVYGIGSEHQLVGYSDVDFAGNIETRSTTGYAFFSRRKFSQLALTEAKISYPQYH
ncbi:hypothetical protein DMN91_011658 [Ooceraea biroi]|uniref:ATP-dependent DNA helicase n=1 Tax=Ooceraea biroi TaxID=2015173 RepID=A0A3L8D606_OOCBI|nr:hypothetical protein DMN91_011658 [Ooceraea biroi]